MYKSEWALENATKEKLGGESDGALTQLLKLMICRNITKYYTMINNTYYLKSMQDAIQASLYHYSSTDQRPDHSRCPKGSSSLLF